MVFYSISGFWVVCRRGGEGWGVRFFYFSVIYKVFFGCRINVKFRMFLFGDFWFLSLVFFFLNKVLVIGFK